MNENNENVLNDNSIENKKEKKGICGKLIGWLFLVVLIGMFGYLIWQNGGIPEDGFNLGEIIGTETPEELKEQIAETPMVEPDPPSNYEVARKLASLESSAGQSLFTAYSVYYHIESTNENTNAPEYRDMITAMTGITDFDNVVGISASHNASGKMGVYKCILIEFKDGIDTAAIAESVYEYADPSTWNFGSEDFDPYYKELTKEDLFVSGKGNYLYIVLISDELIGFGKSVNPEQLIKTFNNTVH